LSADREHLRIEEHNLIDRYVRGTMPAAERAEFEDHLVDCAGCQEQIDIARSLRQAVRESVAETGVVGRERQWSGWRWAAIAAFACLLIAVTVDAVFLLERQRARSELASARAELAQQAENARLSLERPPVVFGLSLSREAAEPRDITIPREQRWMVFLAEIDATRYSRYRASVIGSRGEEIWKQDGIRPNSPDSISVAIPSVALHPGTFTLVVSGQQPDGSLIPVARFPLRVAAGK
jgi:anti-sigma factor RsiW